MLIKMFKLLQGHLSAGCGCTCNRTNQPCACMQLAWKHAWCRARSKHHGAPQSHVSACMFKCCLQLSKFCSVLAMHWTPAMESAHPGVPAAPDLGMHERSWDGSCLEEGNMPEGDVQRLQAGAVMPPASSLSGGKIENRGGAAASVRVKSDPEAPK